MSYTTSTDYIETNSTAGLGYNAMMLHISRQV